MEHNLETHELLDKYFGKKFIDLLLNGGKCKLKVMDCSEAYGPGTMHVSLFFENREYFDSYKIASVFVEEGKENPILRVHAFFNKIWDAENMLSKALDVLDQLKETSAGAVEVSEFLTVVLHECLRIIDHEQEIKDHLYNQKKVAV